MKRNDGRNSGFVFHGNERFRHRARTEPSVSASVAVRLHSLNSGACAENETICKIKILLPI